MILIKNGLIIENNQTVKKDILIDNNVIVKIDENIDTVSVDGREIQLKKHIYIMLNKPSGYVSATEDKKKETEVKVNA